MEITERRFWAKVARGPKKKCWTWTGAVTNRGYGNFYHNGAYVGAHRVAWLLAHGEIPEGLCVLHKCDNRRCVNPYHLWLGTKSDNSLDCSRKGRRYSPSAECLRRGEQHGIAKLTNQQALEIYRRYSEQDTTLRRLADEFGIGRQSVWNIVHGKTWAHLTGAEQC